MQKSLFESLDHVGLKSIIVDMSKLNHGMRYILWIVHCNIDMVVKETTHKHVLGTFRPDTS